MNVAFLFNSDHPCLGGYYGLPIMETILGTNILQSDTRSMRILIGDICIYGIAINHNLDLFKVYQPISFDQLKKAKLERTFTSATVFCWLFQNMTLETAEKLNLALNPFPAYLGAMDVNFSNPLHLYFFRNTLIEMYRIENKKCSIFYEMGEEDSADIGLTEIFEKNGFVVGLEDAGARRTIFDTYDSIEHFQRIESFQNYFSQLANVNDISNIIYNLEELHPKLFDVLAAAARTLERAETEEDLAQVGLSGRRFLEKFADYVFPPQEQEWKGRKVGKAQYRNRIWAYLEIICNNTVFNFEKYGNEIDELIDLFNLGLHANPNKAKIENMFVCLIQWLSDVIQICPSYLRKPYLAYEKELNNFLHELLE